MKHTNINNRLNTSVGSTSVINVNFAYEQFLDTEEAVMNKHLMPFALSLPPAFLAKAYDDCLAHRLIPSLQPEPEAMKLFFLPWLMFTWLPKVSWSLDDWQNDKTIAENYLCTDGVELSRSERGFILDAVNSPYTIYRVKRICPDNSVYATDVLLNQTKKIASDFLGDITEIGSCFLTKTINIRFGSALFGLYPGFIHSEKNKIPEFEHLESELNKHNVTEEQSLTTELLRDNHQDDIIGAFLNAFESFSEPSLVEAEDAISTHGLSNRVNDIIPSGPGPMSANDP